MLLPLICLMSGLFGLFTFFKKKLLALLMIELCFISLVWLHFTYNGGEFGANNAPLILLLMGFMVMESVLGLSSLIVSCRNSTSFLDPFFGC